MTADENEVTVEMTAAGMREWDKAMKEGERQWPNMLTRVFLAMQQAQKVKTDDR